MYRPVTPASAPPAPAEDDLSAPALVLEGIRKSYGRTDALVDVSLRIEAGQILALLGPNGAGKTTLVSIAAGLRRADAGSVHVAGVDVMARPAEASRHLGLAPQETGVYGRVRVRENLRYFGRLHGLHGRQLDERVEETASALGLIHLLDRRPGQMSGGERRRLHTALAMMHAPPLLLLDEPTVGADVHSRSGLLELVRTLAARGSAVCYSTHYLAEVDGLGADVAILSSGRLAACGTRAEVVGAHGRAEVVLTFDGPPPALVVPGVVAVRDGEVRIATTEPERVVVSVMAGLGDDARRLRSLAVLEPSLESIYLAITRGKEELDVVA
jgi:ABC-2 type transport system ATP-binding protein